jgi:hypothetical protein
MALGSARRRWRGVLSAAAATPRSPSCSARSRSPCSSTCSGAGRGAPSASTSSSSPTSSARRRRHRRAPRAARALAPGARGRRRPVVVGWPQVGFGWGLHTRKRAWVEHSEMPAALARLRAARERDSPPPRRAVGSCSSPTATDASRSSSTSGATTARVSAMGLRARALEVRWFPGTPRRSSRRSAGSSARSGSSSPGRSRGGPCPGRSALRGRPPRGGRGRGACAPATWREAALSEGDRAPRPVSRGRPGSYLHETERPPSRGTLQPSQPPPSSARRGPLRVERDGETPW